MRQCESVWPEENRGKCFGTAVLAGGGAEGRGSRRFSGAPYGFALARWRAQAERRARGTGVRGRHSLVPGRCLLVRRSTHVGRGVTLVGARATLAGAMPKLAGARVGGWCGPTLAGPV